jgi:hypothetical protein
MTKPTGMPSVRRDLNEAAEGVCAAALFVGKAKLAPADGGEKTHYAQRQLQEQALEFYVAITATSADVDKMSAEEFAEQQGWHFDFTREPVKSSQDVAMTTVSELITALGTWYANVIASKKAMRAVPPELAARFGHMDLSFISATLEALERAEKLGMTDVAAKLRAEIAKMVPAAKPAADATTPTSPIS